jgi:hypothetical protein
MGRISVLLLSLLISWEANAQAVPPLEFVYDPPKSNNAFFGCGGVVGVDVALQNCTTLSPTANDFIWTVEFQPTPALKLWGLEIPIVPELGVQYSVPHYPSLYFKDSQERSFSAENQASFRFGIGYDTYFYDRHLWGSRAMLKVGGSCLLTRPMDLNPRREGCDDLDLDNWFVKGLLARTVYIRGPSRDREIAYVQASVYHEVPDHDFASKPDTVGYVKVFNDDGLELTYADFMFLGRGPSVRVPGSRWTIDFRLGGAVGIARQVETATSVNGNALMTLNLRHNLAITTGAKYTHRWGSITGLVEDGSYWQAQAYFQWRPDLVVFWDHRY